MPSSTIILDVSGTRYRTHKATLQASPYFKNLMARWDDRCDRQGDDSLFVDADPDIFQHVLSFMRRPSQFPLFWTKAIGFDYVLYNKLEVEADYFLLHDLRDWIKEKCYLEAVKMVIEVKAISEHEFGARRDRSPYDRDTELQIFFGSYSGEKRFRNPCAIHSDDRNIRGCRSCDELMRAFGPHYDDPQNRLTIVSKRIDFDQTICVNRLGS